MKGKLTCLAGGAESRGNAWLYETDAARVLLDCGAEPNGETPWLSSLAEVDAVVITHAHWDHCAGLPGLFERHPKARVVATGPTKLSMARTLEGVLANRRTGEARASAIQDSLETVKFHERLKFADFELELEPAGHIAGAAMVRIHAASQTLLYTSDFSPFEQFSAPAATIGQTDVLVMECAVANVRFEKSWREDAWAELSSLNRATLIGVSIDGQAEEILAGFAANQIDVTVHESLASFVSTSYTLDECRHRLSSGEVVIAVGGDLEPGSPAGELAIENISNNSAWIVTLGATKGLASALRRTHRRSKLVYRGQSYGRVKCRHQHISMTNHATREDIVEAAESSQASQIVLFHNHADALHAVGRAIGKQTSADVKVADVGTTLEFPSSEPKLD